MSRSAKLQEQVDLLEGKVKELSKLVVMAQNILAKPIPLRVGETEAQVETANDVLELLRGVMKLCDAMPSERVKLVLTGGTLTVGPADLEGLADQLEFAA